MQQSQRAKKKKTQTISALALPTFPLYVQM